MFQSYRVSILSTVVCGILAVFMYVACTTYLTDLNALQKYSAYSQLGDFAHMRAHTVQDVIAKALYAAQAQASALGRHAEVSVPAHMANCSAPLFDPSLKRIGFMTRQGEAYFSDGTRTIWKSPIIIDSIFSGHPGLVESTTDPFDNTPIVVAAAPVYKNGAVDGAAVLLFSERLFANAMRNVSLTANGPTLLVSRSGALVYPFPDLGKTKDAIADSSASGLVQPGMGQAAFQKAMRSGKSGVDACTMNGVAYTMAYVPVNLNGWYLFTLQSTDSLLEKNTRLARLNGALFKKFLAAGVLFLLYVLFFQCIAVRKTHSDTQQIHALTSNIPGGVLRVRNDGEFFRMESCSAGLYTMSGYTADEFQKNFGDNYLNFIIPEDRTGVQQEVQKQLQEQGQITIEYRALTKNGEQRWFMGKGQPWGPNSRYIDIVIVDVTDQKRFEDLCALEADRYRQLFELSGSMFYEFDCVHRTLTMGQGFEERFGYVPDTNTLLNPVATKAIHPADREKFQTLVESAKSGCRRSEATLRLRKLTGRHVWCQVQQVTLYDKNNKLSKVIGKITDVDKQVRSMERLNREKQRDAFTRLLNKVSTREVVDGHLSGLEKPELGAMCVIDLDHFKRINDTYGHETGDAVLFQAAKHLRQTFRSSDIIGRIGGDEFLVFLKNVPDINVVLQKLAALRQLFHEGSYVNGVDTRVTISVGVALSPQHGPTYARLFRNADKALYKAKLTRDAVAVFDDATPRSSDPLNSDPLNSDPLMSEKVV